MSCLKSFSNSRMPNRQAGLTLAELMIGLALSLFLMIGVVTLFVNQKSTYRTNIAVSESQDMGRAAVEMISFDLRMLGYQGCADAEMPPEGSDASQTKGARVMAVGSFLGTAGTFQETALRGYETDVAGWSAGEETAITQLVDGTASNGEVLSGTDVFVVQYASVVPIDITSHDVASAQFTIDDDTSKTIGQGDLLIVSDCDRSTVFQRTNEPGDPIAGPVGYGDNGSFVNTNDQGVNGRFIKPYAAGEAVLRRFTSKIYFVGPTGRTNPAGEAINALFVKPSGSSTPSEMIAGVDQLQVVYGYLDGSNNVRYLDADDGALDMRRVVSAKIGLLLSSSTPVLEEDDGLTYVLAGQSVAPEGTAGATLTHAVDKKLRRAFNVMIPMRNRRETM